MSRGDVRIVEAGDAALVAEFEDTIDPQLNARAVALADTVRAARVEGVLDVVPAFRSVTVYFDPLTTNLNRLVASMRSAATATEHVPVEPSGEPIEVPVCYGGELGPDLPEVARFAGVSESEVVWRHTAATYRVYMLGFVPGFAYLGLVDRSIAAPRRAAPRTQVPVGSVALAGELTGVYPSLTPGGWQIIGRTRVRPYDGSRSTPCLFRPGDTVRFRAIDRAAYDAAGTEAGLS